MKACFDPLSEIFLNGVPDAAISPKGMGIFIMASELLFLQMNAYDPDRFDVFYKDEQIGSIKHCKNSVMTYQGTDEKSFPTTNEALTWLKERYIARNRKHIEILRKRATTMLNNANRILARLEAMDGP
jgi:hypothetical protein